MISLYSASICSNWSSSHSISSERNCVFSLSSFSDSIWSKILLKRTFFSGLFHSKRCCIVFSSFSISVSNSGVGVRTILYLWNFISIILDSIIKICVSISLISHSVHPVVCNRSLIHLNSKILSCNSFICIVILLFS